MKNQPTLTVTQDFVDDLDKIVRSFKRDAVLVGIPETNANRNPNDKENSGINNAAILAINNFGSPINNIPARPVMEIGIRNAQKDIAEAFKQGTRAALSKGFAAMSPTYNRIGMIAANAIKKAINSQDGIKEPSEVTLKIREARGFKGNKALIVTGQMRNAITYVVKDEE